MAIMMVLVAHLLIFFGPFVDVNFLIYFAVFGVELFFALSGFLIGNILIRIHDQGLDANQLRQFWVRRFFRTFPAYFVATLVIFLTARQFDLSYFVFLQNYDAEALNIFQVSWSLTIEEYFYLLFPLILFLIKKSGMSRNPLLHTLLIFLCVPLLLRLLVHLSGEVPWDYGIRKQIHLRLDSIAYGVLLALLYRAKPDFFVRYSRSMLTWLIVIAGFFGLWWYYNESVNVFGSSPSLIANVLFFSLAPALSAVLIGMMVHFKQYPPQKISRFVYAASITSYSLYIVHFEVFERFVVHVTDIKSAFLYSVLALLISIVLTMLLYYSVEKPFMKLRNIWSERVKAT